MIITTVVSSIASAWGIINFFNDDYFYAKETAERYNQNCEFKYVGKTIVQDGERLFELTDPDGQKYILFKQVCEK